MLALTFLARPLPALTVLLIAPRLTTLAIPLLARPLLLWWGPIVLPRRLSVLRLTRLLAALSVLLLAPRLTTLAIPLLTRPLLLWWGPIVLPRRRLGVLRLARLLAAFSVLSLAPRLTTLAILLLARPLLWGPIVLPRRLGVLRLTRLLAVVGVPLLAPRLTTLAILLLARPLLWGPIVLPRRLGVLRLAWLLAALSVRLFARPLCPLRRLILPLLGLGILLLARRLATFDLLLFTLRLSTCFVFPLALRRPALLLLLLRALCRGRLCRLIRLPRRGLRARRRALRLGLLRSLLRRRLWRRWLRRPFALTNRPLLPGSWRLLPSLLGRLLWWTRSGLRRGWWRWRRLTLPVPRARPLVGQALQRLCQRFIGKPTFRARTAGHERCRERIVQSLRRIAGRCAADRGVADKYCGPDEKRRRYRTDNSWTQQHALAIPQTRPPQHLHPKALFRLPFAPTSKSDDAVEKSCIRPLQRPRNYGVRDGMRSTAGSAQARRQHR